MEPVWIGLGVMVVVGVVLAVAWKGATLDQLEPLDGEQTRFEEEKLTVRVRSERTGGENAPFCTVRVTNRRIIVAQGSVLGKRKQLRFVVELTDAPAMASDLGETLRQGYLSLSVERSAITIDTADDGATSVVIPIAGSMQGGRRLEIPTQRADEYRSVLG